MSASMEACIARHAALLSPPLPVSSPPLPLTSPLTTSLTVTRASLGYRVAEIRMRALLPSTSRKTNILEADAPPQKRACLTTPAPRFKVGESSEAGAARQPGPIESDLMRYRDDRDFLRARVNTLFRDRPDHHRIAMLLDKEAMYAHEAWAGFEDRNHSSTNKVGFLNPMMITADLCFHEKFATIDYLAQSLTCYEFYLAPFLQGRHYVLLIICPKDGRGFILNPQKDS
nr:ulp1 protease family, C-terminal catalytic domain-containing protein [Tanacetum cinerariifolium]